MAIGRGVVVWDGERCRGGKTAAGVREGDGRGQVWRKRCDGKGVLDIEEGKKGVRDGPVGMKKGVVVWGRGGWRMKELRGREVVKDGKRLMMLGEVEVSHGGDWVQVIGRGGDCGWKSNKGLGGWSEMEKKIREGEGFRGSGGGRGWGTYLFLGLGQSWYSR